jgi:hypothetical protein
MRLTNWRKMKEQPQALGRIESQAVVLVDYEIGSRIE